MSGRSQWKTDRQALDAAVGKPCVKCGEPSVCVVRDWGIAPACHHHGEIAKKLGYIVVFKSDLLHGEERKDDVHSTENALRSELRALRTECDAWREVANAMVRYTGHTSECTWAVAKSDEPPVCQCGRNQVIFYYHQLHQQYPHK